MTPSLPLSFLTKELIEFNSILKNQFINQVNNPSQKLNKKKKVKSYLPLKKKLSLKEYI